MSKSTTLCQVSLRYTDNTLRSAGQCCIVCLRVRISVYRECYACPFYSLMFFFTALIIGPSILLALINTCIHILANNLVPSWCTCILHRNVGTTGCPRMFYMQKCKILRIFITIKTIEFGIFIYLSVRAVLLAFWRILNQGNRPNKTENTWHYVKRVIFCIVIEVGKEGFMSYSA